MIKVFTCLMVLFVYICSAKAQHCEFDGSVALILDIRNKDTDKPVPNLDVKLVDKDSLPYYRMSWQYVAGYPIEKDNEYKRFVYISDKILNEVNKEGQVLPKSVLNKYLLWLGPQSYRNAFPLNLSKKLYLNDKAAIDFTGDGLKRKTHYISFTEKTLFIGCTDGSLWRRKEIPFHTVYFSDEEIEHMEKVR